LAADQRHIDPAEEAPLSRWGAFAYPNFRRFWFASLARVFGMQFRFIGSAWLVQTLTGSTVWLGVVGLAGAVPTILLAVPAGALADRVDHKRLLLVSRTLSTTVHFAMATVVVTDAVELWMVMLWSVLAGILSAAENPAGNAMLPRLIDMRAVASAVAFNGSIWNGMRIIGPATAGVVIAWVGIGQAFMVTAVGFAVSTLLVLTLRLGPKQERRREHGAGMLEGLRYIFQQKIFLATIGLSFFTSVFGSSYVVLLPNFADEVLGNLDAFGPLEAAAGIGAFLGTLSIVRFGTGRYSGQIMLLAAAVFGVFVAGFAAARWLPLSFVLLFAAGFSSSVYLNLGMTTIQVRVPDELRGRVMGVWGMTWFLSSVGGVPVGIAATVIGTPLAIALGALSVSVFAVLLLTVVSELRHLPDPRAARAEAPASAAGGG
jgi:MFS family permease